MINSWTFTFLRLFFLCIFGGTLVIYISKNDLSFILFLIIILFILTLDYFFNQKLFILKNKVIIFKNFRFITVLKNDITAINIFSKYERKVPGKDVKVIIYQKNKNHIKLNLGPIILWKNVEERIKNIFPGSKYKVKIVSD